MNVCGKDLSNTLSKLAYKFKCSELLKLALTHSSVANSENNQRLEFLGDAILNFVIADYLYKHYPQASEGELTRTRSSLVQGSTLCELSKNLCLGSKIYLGTGELRSGGDHKSSILADTLEALIAAIYLDSGLVEVYNLIIDWYQQLNYLGAKIQDVSQQDILHNNKDPKTRLQEFLHSKGLELPQYTVVKISGMAHKQQFTVKCTVHGVNGEFYGVGTSIKRAEQAAAAKLLAKL